jgi:hypothetical protein
MCRRHGFFVMAGFGVAARSGDAALARDREDS